MQIELKFKVIYSYQGAGVEILAEHFHVAPGKGATPKLDHWEDLLGPHRPYKVVQLIPRAVVRVEKHVHTRRGEVEGEASWSTVACSGKDHHCFSLAVPFSDATE